jgi:hypothetical protein
VGSKGGVFLNMEAIKIPKGFFYKMKWKIKLPTFKCKICEKDVLDTPLNRLKYERATLSPPKDIKSKE